MNELIEEIERTAEDLRLLNDDKRNYERQSSHGMVSVVNGELKRVRAYMAGLQKAKELIDG